MSASPRGRGWIFQVTALCVVLGMLLALSLRTQRRAVSEGIPNRWPALRAEFINLRQQNARLQKDLADYKERYEQLLSKHAEGQKGTEELEAALQEMKLLAGVVAVRGPGLVVTLMDSPMAKANQVSPDNVEDYIVHDYDIRAVVNELFAAGAEAISVNGQRLIATSSIRCVGPVILVNAVRVAPPYVIKAIGKPDVLQRALDMPGGAADSLFLLKMIEVKPQSDIVVPAYGGSTRFNWARPLEQSKPRRREVAR
ncbi:MAG: DUF881 domain-containing protein [Armatimonadota bacterium]